MELVFKNRQYEQNINSICIDAKTTIHELLEQLFK